MEDILKHITSNLLNIKSSNMPLGIKGGKLEIGVFFALYSEYFNNTTIREHSIKTLFEVISKYKSLPNNFFSGKLGLGWGVLMLQKMNIIESDKELSSLINDIFPSLIYSFDGHPYQLCTEDDLFSKGIYLLKQRVENKELSRYIIDELLILLVDECENLLLKPIKNIYKPNDLSLHALNSILFFLIEVKNRKIFPYKANLLITEVYKRYNKIKDKPTVDEIIFRTLSKGSSEFKLNDKDLAESLYLLGNLGFYSLLYENKEMFNNQFIRFYKKTNFIKEDLIQILKHCSIDTSCGIGLGLLQLTKN